MFNKLVLIVISTFIYRLFAKNDSLKLKYFVEEMSGSDPFDCGQQQSTVEQIFSSLADCNTEKWAPLPEVKYPASNDRLCCYSLEAVCLHKQVVSKYCQKDNEFYESFDGINTELKNDCLKAGVKVSGQFCKSLATNDLGHFKESCDDYMPCSYGKEISQTVESLPLQEHNSFEIKTLNTLLFSMVLLITISF